jgi:hypothetical protein
MGFFHRDKTKSPAYRRKMAQKVAGQQIKYTTERVDDNDLVIGHAGALIVRNDELLVYASQDVVFRANVTELTVSELMSRDGVILTAPDLSQDGRVRTVIAYYSDYIKRNL